MSFRLITSEDIKRISKGGSSWNAEFEQLLDQDIIPAVTKRFATYCHRPDWDKVARIEYFGSSDRAARTLFLSSPPVYLTTPLRIYQDSADPPTWGAGTELTNGFVIFEEEGIIENRNWFSATGPKSIKVTYTGGFLTGDGIGTPEDVRFAAIEQTKIIFDRREEFGLTGRSLEGGSVSLLAPIDLPLSVTRLLDDYRVYRGC